MLEKGLIGGTFDRLHDGHIKLIQTALNHCEKIELWLSSDKLSIIKDKRILTWENRREEIIARFKDYFPKKISIGLLEDQYGPAVNDVSAGAIFCTPQTREKCQEINIMRSEESLSPLEIIEVDFSLAWDDDPISSSRIRDGEIDRSGKSWIPEIFRSSSMSLSKKVESKLKEPFGQLITGPEEQPLLAMEKALSAINPDSTPIIAVGDVTTRCLELIGRPAEIALIDGLTRRKKWHESDEIDHSAYDFTIDCESPAGFLTPSLLQSCESAVSSWKKNGSSHLIKVVGEEDLAPLFLHPISPLGAVILYGQPGKGVVIRHCTEETKSHCRKLLEGFETTY